MKKFATYLKVSITKKPEWFDSFYEKYSEPYDTHITITQPRYVDEQKIEDIKLQIDAVLKKYEFKDANKLFLFDKCVYDKEPDGTYTVMLLTHGNSLLSNLQKDLREELSGFGNYVEQVMESYETDFKPHLTVGNGMNIKDLKEVENSLNNQSLFVEGAVTELVLVVVDNMNLTEIKTPENLTVFTL